MKAWCRAQGLPVSATFVLSRFGKGPARLLADCWADKMWFLHTLSAEAPEAGAPVGAADLAVWREPPALRALLLDDDVPSDLKAVVGARAREIRGLRCL